MLAIERKNQILEKLHQEGKVVVSDLSRLYQVTEETIRRDLEKLENEGLAKKTYGGAILNQSLNTDVPYTVRKRTNVDAKKYIAELIGSLINDGDYIALDASSTALFVVKNIIHKKNITLITNSIEILLELAEKSNWNIFSTGGALKEGSLSLVGYSAERMVSEFHVDLAVCSCKGIDLSMGVTDSNEKDAQIKQAIFQAAKKRVLAVDDTKFDKISFTRICDLSSLDLVVTNCRPQDKWAEKLKELGADVLY